MAGFGMDLGTASTVVCDADGAFVFDEPSVLLRTDRNRRGDHVVVGREAADLLGCTPPHAQTLRPISAGVVTDLGTAHSYLQAVVRRVLPRPWSRLRSRAVIGVPTGATPLEQRALLECVEEAGVGRACVLDATVAGALGCGVDPLDRRVHMVLDVGEGTAEVVAFCAGGVLATRTRRSAGARMTTAVQEHLREHHRLVVADASAEKLKITAGTAAEGEEITVHGRDTASSRPRAETVPAAELREAVAPVTASVVHALAACLDDLPTRALDDLLADGMLLVGGASLTTGLDRAVETAFGLPVKRVENPLTCVAEGAARASCRPEVLAAYARS